MLVNRLLNEQLTTLRFALSTLSLMLLSVPSSTFANAEEIVVRNTQSLVTALKGIKPDTHLKIAAGEYSGGHALTGISGLTIEALDPAHPPVFRGGNVAFQFSRCDRLTLRYLHFTQQRQNGLNIDDGGDVAHPVVDVTLDHLLVTEIGPQGNHDAIKCSGIDRLAIRDCTLSGWGGQGIDFVGCHRAVISGCKLQGRVGFTATAGIQLKGGTSDILVEKCSFLDAGQRPLNVGGSTGQPYFRPLSAKYEAARITVRSNVIEGSTCAAAFVGVDGAEFTDNTILYPTKWIFRILQETKFDGFAPCRNVVIRSNRIVFRREQVQTEINIGGDTMPETFRFESNHWLATDRPQDSQPRLPVDEMSGVYGQPIEVPPAK